MWWYCQSYDKFHGPLKSFSLHDLFSQIILQHASLLEFYSGIPQTLRWVSNLIQNQGL